MTRARIDSVDDLFCRLFGAGAPAEDAAAVAPNQGRLLEVLCRAVGARRVLEIGTGTGYSTRFLARSGAEVVTLEVDSRVAEVARSSMESDRISLLVGDAATTLASLDGPFDLIFIDADKKSNPVYLEHALRLSRPGTLIVADNVVRDGGVVSPTDANAEGARRFLEMLAGEPRVVATALQTVGVKGWDGFALAVVLDPSA